MKKIDVLAWGVKLLAVSRGVSYDTDYKEYLSMSVHSDSVPLIADVRMLCESLGMPPCCCYTDRSWGVTVIDLDSEWLGEHGHEEYVSNGMEMWKRSDYAIGESLGYKTERYDSFSGRGSFGFLFKDYADAKRWCDDNCAKDRNADMVFMVRDADKDWTSPNLYVCVWNSEMQALRDITTEENERLASVEEPADDIGLPY